MCVDGTVTVEVDGAVVDGAVVVGEAELAEDAAAAGGVTEIVAWALTGGIPSPVSLTVAVLVIEPVAVVDTNTGTVTVPIEGFEIPPTAGTKVQVTVFDAPTQEADWNELETMEGVPSRISPAGSVSVTVAVLLIVPVKVPEIENVSVPPGATIGCAAVLTRVTVGDDDGCVTGAATGTMLSDAVTGGATTIGPLSPYWTVFVRVAVLVIAVPIGPVVNALMDIVGNANPGANEAPISSTVQVTVPDPPAGDVPGARLQFHGSWVPVGAVGRTAVAVMPVGIGSVSV